MQHYGWEPLYRTGSVLTAKQEPLIPRFSVCLYEAPPEKYLGYLLTEVYAWAGCHEILLPEQAFKQSEEFLRQFPDAQNKIVCIDANSSDQLQLRNRFAEHVRGTHVLLLEPGEYYTAGDLELLYEDARTHPEVDLFLFDTSPDVTRRTYRLFDEQGMHLEGPHEMEPPQRIYKWHEGTHYDSQHEDIPLRADGQLLRHQNYLLTARFTRAICTRTRTDHESMVG